MSRTRFAYTLPCGAEIVVCQGDVTEETSDAVVNAANEQLQLGGGVAGAIRRRGGPSIQEECDAYVREHGPVPAGGAAATGAGSLPAKSVIHAVGPRWGEGEEDEKLSRAIRSALRLAQERGFATISFPALSSGIFGFPKDRCALVFFDTLERALPGLSGIAQVRLCNLDDETAALFQAEAERRAASHSDS